MGEFLLVAAEEAEEISKGLHVANDTGSWTRRGIFSAIFFILNNYR